MRRTDGDLVDVAVLGGAELAHPLGVALQVVLRHALVAPLHRLDEILHRHWQVQLSPSKIKKRPKTKPEIDLKNVLLHHFVLLFCLYQ